MANEVLTQKDALKKVPTHVEPKDCFMWENLDLKKKGVDKRFTVIPGTGCAHWVAHQKGWNSGENFKNGCCENYLIRVTDVIKAGSEVKPNDVAIGNVWAIKSGGASHCGIVIKVEAPTAAQKEYADLRGALEKAIAEAKKGLERAKSLIAANDTLITDFEKENKKGAFKKGCPKGFRELAAAQTKLQALKSTIDAAQRVHDTQELK